MERKRKNGRDGKKRVLLLRNEKKWQMDLLSKWNDRKGYQVRLTSRLGRFISLDPLVAKYANDFNNGEFFLGQNSPYFKEQIELHSLAPWSLEKILQV